MKGWTVFILWQRQHNITNSPCADALFGSQLHNCEELPDYVDVFPSQILIHNHQPCIWCWQYICQGICFLAMMMGQSGYPARNRRFSIFPGKGCRWLDSYSSHLTRFSAPLSSPLSEENQHEPVSERENNLIKVVGVLRPCFIYSNWNNTTKLNLTALWIK